jgi:curved DNA-binding protein CbpA
MPRTHYEVLGLALDALLEDIKAAYRNTQLQHHPDRTREASVTEREKSEAISKAANTAYEVLCDATSRSLYDVLLFPKQTNAFPTYTKPTSR